MVGLSPHLDPGKKRFLEAPLRKELHLAERCVITASPCPWRSSSPSLCRKIKERDGNRCVRCDTTGAKENPRQPWRFTRGKTQQKSASEGRVHRCASASSAAPTAGTRSVCCISIEQRQPPSVARQPKCLPGES